MQEFVAYAKANPGKLSYGHGNTTGHIVGEAIKKRNGIDIARVPYTTMAHAITDLIGDRTQIVVADLISGLPQIQAGKLVGLATIFPSVARSCPKSRPRRDRDARLRGQGVDRFVRPGWPATCHYFKDGGCG